MDYKMKNLRKIAGISIFFILFFMVIALLRFQSHDDLQLLPDQLEIFYNENWVKAILDVKEVSQVELKNQKQMQTLVNEAIEEKGENITLPYAGESNPGDTVIFRNILSPDYAGLTMNFATTNAMVRVILDGQEIYKYDFEGNVFEKSMKSSNHFVDIPNVIQDGELWIMMSSLSPNVAATLDGMIIESRDMVVIGMVGNNIADIGCCLLIALMAIIMFVLAMIRRYTRQPARGEVFLVPCLLFLCGK